MSQNRCMGCMCPMDSGSICTHCGYDPSCGNAVHQLPTGTLLQDQYLVGRVLGQGGFGITYLGWDEYLDIPVAIKEYFPNGMVMRDTTATLDVTDCSGKEEARFQNNKQRFLREAKMLARFSQVPEIVQVRNFFLAHNTAYIVMEYVEGQDLKHYVRSRGGKLSVEETLSILKPMIKTMGMVHKAGLVHRDISPDNIMMLPGGGAKLLDFGAVRDVGAAEVDKNLSKSTEAILKQGYAPIEQYQKRGSLGPWTDVYAMCATIYFCLTGEVPPDAPERLLGDEDVDFRSRIPDLTPAQEAALAHGMELRAENRTPSMEVLYQELFEQTAEPVKADQQPREIPRQEPRPVQKPEQQEVQTQAMPRSQLLPENRPVPKPRKQKRSKARKLGLALIAAAAVFAVWVGVGVWMQGRSGLDGTENVQQSGQETTPGTQMADNLVSGTCGAATHWTLDLDTGSLSITGVGSIGDYDAEWAAHTDDLPLPPWQEYREQIQSVTVGDRVVRVGINAFAQLPNLRYAKMEGSVQEIASGAFFGSSLEEVELGQVTRICDGAFSCTQLKAVEIPQGVSVIEEGAFEECLALETLTVHGDPVVAFSPRYTGGIFRDVSVLSPDLTVRGLSNTLLEEYARLEGLQFEAIGTRQWDASGTCGPNLDWYYDAQTGFLKIDGLGMMYDYGDPEHEPSRENAPWREMMENFDRGQYVSMGDGVLSVGEYAFYGCRVEAVRFGSQLQTIGFQAFCGSEMWELVLPENVKKIDSFAFNWCTNLESVILPEDLPRLEGCPFNMCQNLKEFYVGKNTAIAPDNGGTPFSHEEEPEVPGELTIYSLPGSRAEKYAAQNGFAYGLGYQGCKAEYQGQLDSGDSEAGWFLGGETLMFYGGQYGDVYPFNLSGEALTIWGDHYSGDHDVTAKPLYARYADQITRVVFLPGSDALAYGMLDDLPNLRYVDFGTSAPQWNSLTDTHQGYDALYEVVMAETEWTNYVQNYYFRDCTRLHKVTFRGGTISSKGMFEGCTNLREIWFRGDETITMPLGLESDVTFYLPEGAYWLIQYARDNNISYEIIE